MQLISSGFGVKQQSEYCMCHLSAKMKVTVGGCCKINETWVWLIVFIDQPPEKILPLRQHYFFYGSFWLFLFDKRHSERHRVFMWVIRWINFFYFGVLVIIPGVNGLKQTHSIIKVMSAVKHQKVIHNQAAFSERTLCHYGYRYYSHLSEGDAWIKVSGQCINVNRKGRVFVTCEYTVVDPKHWLRKRSSCQKQRVDPYTLTGV